MQPLPILLLCRNNAKQLRKCVDSIISATRYDYELHIIDNASTDQEHLALLDELQGVGHAIVWRETTNRWVLGLNNCLATISKSQPPYYLVSDADIVFPRLDGACWLERLVLTMEKYPFLGKLGASLSQANIAGKLHMRSVLEREQIYSSILLTPDVYLALVDTTAAIYRPDMFVWERFQFYPGHGSAMKPYYYAGRHKEVTVYHLGWDEDEYSPVGAMHSHQLEEKVRCFSLYGGFADPVTLRSVSWAAALHYKLIGPLARAFWGARLLFYWALYLAGGRLIRINKLMNKVR